MLAPPIASDGTVISKAELNPVFSHLSLSEQIILRHFLSSHESQGSDNLPTHVFRTFMEHIHAYKQNTQTRKINKI